MNKVKIAFGMTGTLPEEKTIPYYCLHSLLGARIQKITPRELMDAGYISDIEISQYRLNYRDIDKQKKLFIKCAEYALSPAVLVPMKNNPRKTEKVKLKNPEFLIQYEKEFPAGLQAVKNSIYYDKELSEKEKEDKYIDILKTNIKLSTATNFLVIEKMMVHFMEERIDVLCNEVLQACPYNTLVLAHHTEYLVYVAEEIKKRLPDKIVCVIHGGTNPKERDAVKETLQKNNNCILVASYGCIGTGITLSNLCFGVLFESFKSGTINMQSIGRGLGLSKYKEKYILYDFIDCFDKSISTKAIFRQGKEKIKLYENDENKYDYKIITRYI